MAKSSTVLALDIGAASIKAAEFRYSGESRVTLAAYDYREYGEALTEENRSFAITTVLREIIAANAFTAREAIICISGQFALTRFVKLPPVAEEENRVRQIVEFEAQQNVPFPMDEVIWDYQLIANPEADELEVMFVVIKNEIVEQITGAVQAAGLSPVVVDVAPCACYNAARANHVGDDECAMVLNLGARSTNLLFADRQQFFTRTIPIAGHTITQQIAKEFNIGMEEAEELKRRHGFVALGGAYAEPESEVAGAVSKIVRNVMTRLHGEINRSIGVYRAQQKGNTPKRLYLTGGSSTMGFTDRFFTDKLDMPVEYLNPFQVVTLGPGLSTERLEQVAHMFSEVVGLGLRYCLPQAVEVSLIPESISRQLLLRQKKPYVVAAVLCILLLLVVTLVASGRKAEIYSRLYAALDDEQSDVQLLRGRMDRAIREETAIMKQYTALQSLVARREAWPGVMNQLEELRPQYLWLTQVRPVMAVGDETVTPRARREQERPPPGLPFMPPMDARPRDDARRRPGAAPRDAGELGKQVIVGLEISGHSITVVSHDADPAPPSVQEVPEAEQILPEFVPRDATDADPAAAAADAGQAAARDTQSPVQRFLSNLQSSELFDRDETRITSYRVNETVPNLNSFGIRLRFAEPIELEYE